MPPVIPRKRSRSPTSTSHPPPPAKRAATAKSGAKSKLFDALDATPSASRTVADNKAFLEKLAGEDDDTSLSEADTDEFEDVDIPNTKPGKGGNTDTEEEMDWEDAIPTASTLKASHNIKDVEIKFGGMTEPISASMGKKGPSRKDRQFRIHAHCMHVQFLLFHSLIRNGWICDKEVQKTLVDGLTDVMKAEVERYRKAMGLEIAPTVKSPTAKDAKKSSVKAKGKGKAKAQAKDEQAAARDRIRDWGAEASRLEPNAPNLSKGDPLHRLLKYLSAYWKKKFRITAPGLRKQGYYSPAVLGEEVRSFRNDPHDPTRHGERIKDIKEFRELAKKCEGSRDVGAQLFTALLRGLGLEARLVANLQPLGYGWTKGEEGTPKKRKDQKPEGTCDADGETKDATISSVPPLQSSSKTKPTTKPAAKIPKLPARRNVRGTQSTPIPLDDSSDLSSAPESDSGVSIIDITPIKTAPAKPSGNTLDKDLAFPVYWTEVLSPVSNIYIPCSPLVISTVATNADLLAAFEPRGKQADKSKQVIAYVVAYSPDGTAKDVTVRYLKKHQWPGKAKGVRLPVEKVPVYNKHGKVKKYEEYDWFKDVMRGYARSAEKRTKADEIEDEGDLIPLQPAAKTKTLEKGEESLQAYKQSAEYVLERHLRREEAILPSAKSVRHFTTGKGDNAKSEPVYLRKDVVACKTAESWHKEGREVKLGEQPMKMVPIRAVTLIRKREIEDQLRESGEKPLQGLYSYNQTDWIIPEPIKDGKIPRNAFGNIDVYVPSMVPKGAVHVRLKGTGKICKKLGIDYAEACTGFEFGKQRAVPVLTGVVVAEENEEILREAWREEEEHKRKKEEGKREKMALHMWRKLLMGLRIIERVREEYGDDAGDLKDEINPFTNKNKLEKAAQTVNGHGIDHHDFGGGYIPEDGDDGGGFLRDDQGQYNTEGGGFMADADSGSELGAGGFIVEHDDADKKRRIAAVEAQSSKPISLQAAHADTPVSENTAESQDEEDEQRVDVPKPPTRRKPSTTTQPSRQPPRRRSTATLRTKARKKADTASEDEPSSLSEEHSDAASEGSDSETASAAPPRRREEPVRKSTRSAPRRQAARKSETAVRSHYFQHGSDEETDEVVEKPSKAKNGRTKRGGKRE